MYKMRDDILMTLFGGGIADYDELDKCQYDFEDIYRNMSVRIEQADFNDILIGAIELYKLHIYEKLENKKQQLRKDIAKADLEKLEKLDPCTDIEYYTNYLDTNINILDADIRAVYKEYLADEIEKENELLGFAYLDLEE